jgi:hypothetical protein
MINCGIVIQIEVLQCVMGGIIVASMVLFYFHQTPVEPLAFS